MNKPRELVFDGTRSGFVEANGKRRDFDTIYPILGSRSQATLSIELGASDHAVPKTPSGLARYFKIALKQEGDAVGISLELLAGVSGIDGTV